MLGGKVGNVRYVSSVTFEEPTAADAACNPVLTVVQHDADVPLDLFTDWLDGVQIRTVRAWAGDAIPDVTHVGAGLLVLGGRMNAHDDLVAPWLPATRALLAAAVAARVPTLGICLGAQLLAVACGGRVQVAAPPGLESGVADIHWRPDAARDPLVGALAAERTTPVPILHGDVVVDLPPSAVWLGSSDMYAYQAFRLGSAWGVQFHPEAGADLLGRWADGAGVDAAAIREAYAARESEISAAGRAFAARFASLVRQYATRSSASIVYA